MKALIQGQSIRIDNHDSGSGRPALMDRSVHLHKVMNKDRYNGAEILIPINGSSSIQFRKVKGRNGTIRNQLMNEINKAFRNPKKRDQFTKYVLKRIDQFSASLSNKDRIDSLIEGAIVLASHFNLQNELRESAAEYVGDQIRSFTATIEDDEGNEYFIIQDVKGQNIRIGSDIDWIRSWAKIKKEFDLE